MDLYDFFTGESIFFVLLAILIIVALVGGSYGKLSWGSNTNTGVQIFLGICIIILFYFAYSSFNVEITSDLNDWIGEWEITIINSKGALEGSFSAKAKIIETNKIRFTSNQLGESKFSPTNSAEGNYSYLTGRYSETGSKKQRFELILYPDKVNFTGKTFDKDRLKNSNYKTWIGIKK